MYTTKAKDGRRVGGREFRGYGPTGYLKEAEPIAVERHGRLIGFYIPVEPKRTAQGQAELKDALARLEESVQRVLEETGMTEDELADYFDLNKPIPKLPADRE